MSNGISLVVQIVNFCRMLYLLSVFVRLETLLTYASKGSQDMFVFFIVGGNTTRLLEMLNIYFWRINLLTGRMGESTYSKTSFCHLMIVLLFILVFALQLLKNNFRCFNTLLRSVTFFVICFYKPQIKFLQSLILMYPLWSSKLKLNFSDRIMSIM